MDEPTPERWLPVVGWEGLYEVSDLGRVRSLSRRRRHRNGSLNPWPGRILKPSRDSRGYFTVGLSRGGTTHTQKVHRLVLLAFVGPAPAGMIGRHGPGGQADNRLVNLCWGTHAENEADKIRDGVPHGPRGERHWMSKLTEDDVREIRARYAQGGIRQEDIAREFGITQTNVGCIIRGKTWRHVARSPPK